MNRKFIPYIYILLFFYNLTSVVGQNNADYHLLLLSKDSVENNELKKLNYKQLFKTQEALQSEIQRVLFYLKKEGYYTLYLESISTKNNTSTAFLNLGQKTHTIKIHISENIKENISSYPIKKDTIELTSNKLTKFLETLNSNLEKQGKGLSKFTLSKINIQNSSLIATLNLEEAIQRNTDKIIIKGFQDFPKNYTKHFFKSGKKNILNKKLIENISNKTKQLSFATEIKSPEILFSKDSTFIYVYLQKKQNSSFDGMLNFNSKEQSDGIELSGYLDLRLVNSFHQGETLRLYWKNNGDQKQTINISAELPYLFNSAFKTTVAFNLFRSDSTFSSSNLQASIAYPIGNHSEVALQYQLENSTNLLTVSSTQIADYQKYYVGPSYTFNKKTENEWLVEFSVMTGQRTTDNNTTLQYKLDLTASLLYKLSQRWRFLLKNTSGFLISKDYTLNESYRLGGIHSFRGSKAASIFASKYSFINSEFRYLTQQKSYIYSITDIGRFIYTNQEHDLYSLGIGYSYQLSSSIIDLNYVYGINESSQNNSLINIKFITNF